MVAPIHVDAYLERLPHQWMKEVFYLVQPIILNASPAITESIKFGCPFYNYKGMLCYFTTLNKGKRLVLGFCAGKHMLDEAGVLTAQQGQTSIKHWDFTANETVDFALLSAYIHEAVLVNDFLFEQKKLFKSGKSKVNSGKG